MIYYSQRDPRWADIRYSAEPPHTETVKSAGCGIACAASVVSSLADVIVEPPEMADFSVSNGYRIDGVGTANALFPAVAKKYGLTFMETHDVTRAERCIWGGGLVVCGTSGRPKKIFSTGGHFFLLIGAEGDLLYFFDPDCYPGKYTQYGRERWATARDGVVSVKREIADAEINQYYLFTKGGMTVDQYEELSARIAKLEQPKMIYHYIDQNMPEWARATVQKLVDKNFLRGTEEGLGLTDEMLRVLVLLDRAGAFGA